MTESRTKADFRALRESAGLTQSAVADACEVRVLTVKRWEDERTDWEPPADAWHLVDDAMAAQREAVKAAEGVVTDAAADAAGYPREVTLSYWRTQAQYDAHKADGADFAVVNATARATAQRLRELGFEVRFAYPMDSIAADRARQANEEEAMYEYDENDILCEDWSDPSPYDGPKLGINDLEYDLSDWHELMDEGKTVNFYCRVSATDGHGHDVEVITNRSGEGMWKVHHSPAGISYEQVRGTLQYRLPRDEADLKRKLWMRWLSVYDPRAYASIRDGMAGAKRRKGKGRD